MNAIRRIAPRRNYVESALTSPELNVLLGLLRREEAETNQTTGPPDLTGDLREMAEARLVAAHSAFDLPRFVAEIDAYRRSLDGGRLPKAFQEGALAANKLGLWKNVDDYRFDAENDEISSIFETDDLFETFPSRSQDGRTLYYCAAKNTKTASPDALDARRLEATTVSPNFRCNITRVAFDPATRTFGPPETVFDAEALGKSAVAPRGRLRRDSLTRRISEKLRKNESVHPAFSFPGKPRRARWGATPLNSAPTEKINGDALIRVKQRLKKVAARPF